MNKFGLELVLELVKSSLSQPSDAVFALVHWLVTSSQKFGCVGTGENFSDSDSQPSEVLPNDWNRSNKDDNGPFYSVRYRQKNSNQKYVVKMVFSIGTTWQLILCRTGDDKTVSMSINVEDEVSDTDGYPFKDVDKLLERIRREWLDKMFPPPEEKKASDKRDPDERQPPRGPPDAEQPPPRPRQPFPDYPPHQPFPDPDAPFGPFGGGPMFDQPGGADLDPMGRRGRGGMLMEPPRGGLRGQIPNRFDPPHPFGAGRGVGGFPGRGGGRNFGDAMAPPNFDDNMFM